MKMSFRVLVGMIAVVVLSLSSGCRKSSDSSLKGRAVAAYEKARLALLSRPEVVQIDVVWLLQDMLKTFPDDELQQLVNDRTASFSGNPMMIMLDPYAPRISLPSDPGRGMQRYYVYMQAPFGVPKDRAISYINDYLSKPEKGYMLTHQLMALVWGEESGLEFSRDMLARKDDLLKQIYEEQLNTRGIFYMDLYAERAAFLIRYGKVARADAEKWIERLVQMQNDDGNWPSTHAVLQYDGQFGSSLPPPPHTTVLAMTALKFFIELY